jgi:hypothetical protein
VCTSYVFEQSLGCLSRAFNWVRVGIDLFGQGVLLLPFVGAVAIVRGLFIALIVALYLSFVGGAVLQKTWARWTCFVAAILNLVLVVSSVAQGMSAAKAFFWSAVPVILIIYLFSQSGRIALGAT